MKAVESEKIQNKVLKDVLMGIPNGDLLGMTVAVLQTARY